MKQNALIGLVSLSIFLIVTGCMSLGGAKFPQPAAGFQPKKIYDKTYDQLWTSVRRVLEAERIGIASSDKEGGRMVTDYVQVSWEESRQGTTIRSPLISLARTRR